MCSNYFHLVLQYVSITFFSIVQVSPNFHPTGIAMISLALIADAIVGNVQEKAMKLHQGSNAEVIFYSYGIGFFYLLMFLSLDGSLISGYKAFGENAVESYGLAFIFSLTGYFGMQVVSPYIDFMDFTCTYVRRYFRNIAES